MSKTAEPDATSICLQSAPAGCSFLLAREVHDRLISACQAHLPKQSFGVLLGERPQVGRAFVLLRKNQRDTDPEIRKKFQSYGLFYDTPARGYWADPREQLDLLLKLEGTQQQITAFFHTHVTLDALPTAIDRDLHFHRAIPMAILSFVDVKRPVMRIFEYREGEWREMRIRRSSDPDQPA